MQTIPWAERLEQIGYSLLRLLEGDAVWLLTTPPIGGIACGIIKSPSARDPNACVTLTDLTPPPMLTDPNSPLTPILRQGIPRAIEDLPLIEEYLDNDLPDTLLKILDIHPSLIVPLLVGDEPVGAMLVADREGPSDKPPVDILQAIGEHLGVALQSAYLRDASRRQAEALATLNRIACTVTSSLDIEEVIQRTMAGINEILDVEAGSLLLLDEHTNELYFKITLRGENKRITQFRLNPGQGIAGWVVTNRLPAMANDVSTDPRFYSKIDEAIGFKTSSLLCVPLIVQGQPIGALEVINKRQGYFTFDDQELLTSMCAALSIALDNASLYQEAQSQMRRAALISNITTAVSASLSLPEAIRAIAVHLRQFISFDCGSVCLLDDSSRYLHVYHLTQRADRSNLAPVTIPLDGSGIEWIVQHGEARLMNLERKKGLDLDACIVADLAVRRMISVPLVAQQEVRGVINLTSARPDAYTSADVEALERIAPQLAVAIEKARLFNLMEQHTAEMKTLNRMGERLVSLTDTERILSVALAFVPHLVPGDVHALLLMDEDGGRCGIVLPFTADESLLDAIIEEMTNSLAPVVEADKLALVRRKVIAGHKPMPDDWEPVATLTLPILTHLGPMGVAYLASHKAEDFAGDALRLFSLVVSQIASTIENARLFREVEKERARLAALLSSTTDLIVVVDRAGRVVLANPAAREVFGQGKAWENRLLSEIVENEALLDLFSKTEHHQIQSGEVPLPDGRTLYASLSPISGGDDEQTASWVAAMQDITYLKELDQVKSDFVSTVSHDLRSPLSGILIATQLVSQTGKLNEQQQGFLETIEERVAAMTELIDDLLDVGRIEAGVDLEMVSCAIGPIISQVVNQFEEQIQGKQLRVSIEVNANLPAVMGDESRLQQVLSNLVSNAIKYTPEGGRIAVEAGLGHDEIVASVRDTGIGIPLADQPHIFEKFYRVARREVIDVEGTGLGLAISRSIVEKHGGRIWVESELNVGSTFSFALPTIEAEFLS